jgi:gluconokinase
MVIFLMGAAGSGRNSLGRLLAETLAWDFVDGDSLCSTKQTQVTESGAPPAEATSAALMEALSAALRYWNYHWRDVVVSCPILTEQDQRRVSGNHRSVKFVCLNAPESRDLTAALDQPVDHIRSEVLMGQGSAIAHNDKILTVNASQGADQIVAELISVLILNRWPPRIFAA